MFSSMIQVLGEEPGSMLGRDLEALIQRARDFKKEYGDSYVSVEHLVLGFAEDKRFGTQLFKDFQITVKTLKSAIESIRGKQNVIDQGTSFLFLPPSFGKIAILTLTCLQLLSFSCLCPNKIGWCNLFSHKLHKENGK
jgi:ATP-dependent Clp protease ATP-binding subunit ClpA